VVRWNVARKAVSEIPVASSHKRRAFDASSLRSLEELCESTWATVQDRLPFRDPIRDNELGRQLRRKLFILAENSDLEDLEACSDQYWMPSREALTTKWRA
jgi:hypothetical protein